MAPNLLGSTHGLLLGAESQTAQSAHNVGSKYSQSDVQKRKSTDLLHGDKKTNFSDESTNGKEEYKLEIVWRNIVVFAFLHSIAFYGLYVIFTFQVKLATALFMYFYTFFSGLGITAGAHRLWAHRTYKANLPLRIFLMLAQSTALQNDIHEWVRDHRVHHKFTDTNADPHNASRGFFFSHVGWLLCKKHKDVMTKGKTVDMTDVLDDPVVAFQMKYYVPLVIITNMIIPFVVPWYFWGEPLWIAYITSVTRYVISLHGTWLVNSAAHFYGTKPYDKTIKPTENKFVAVVALGEGWHNYHHIFPWDYKAAELGNYNYNFTTCFLDIMGKIGWATEMKTASKEMIQKRLLRTGDGNWPDIDKLRNNNKSNDSHSHHNDDGELIWGWGDKDMDSEEISEIKKTNRMQA